MNNLVDFDITRVCNLLKQIVNEFCEDGFTWFEDVDEDNMPSLMDVLMTITTLESLKGEDNT